MAARSTNVLRPATWRWRCASPRANCAAACAGFYVFIACIALGVMAIAGIGSVAAGLADGLAREGRVILGGDLAFSLSLREAARTSGRFSTAAGAYRSLPRCAPWRALMTGRTALVEVKAVDAAYPLYGEACTRSAAAAGRGAGATGRRVRRRRRSCAAGPARSQAGRAHHGGRRTDRDSRRADVRTRQACRRHRLWPAAPHQRGGVARDRAAAARQRGALALSFAPARQ
jgi:hypothetical protein